MSSTQWVNLTLDVLTVLAVFLTLYTWWVAKHPHPHRRGH